MSPIAMQAFYNEYLTGLLVVDTRVRIVFGTVEISSNYRIICTAHEMFSLSTR